jgi:hypothetical protein
VLRARVTIRRDLAATERAEALDAVEAVYAAAGVTRFAVWVHENDWAMRADLERRGYTLAETTRGMGIVLDEIRMPRPEIELGATDWDDYLRILGLPPGLLSGADHTAFHVLVARVDDADVATAMAFDHHGDCGIYKSASATSARSSNTCRRPFRPHDTADERDARLHARSETVRSLPPYAARP